MPELVRMYIRHVAIGFVLGLAFTGLLLWLNVGNLWHLVRATEGGGIAVVMLVVFNTIVFAGVQFAIAVMGLADSDQGESGGHKAMDGLALPAVAKQPRRGRPARG